VVMALLSVNAITVVVLLTVIGRDVWLVIEGRRRGLAAARLHVRIVGLFCIIAATPAVLLAVIANVVLDRGIDQQISSRTKAVISNSVLVADMYLNEQADSVGRNVVGLAFELTRAKPLFDFDRERFRQLLAAQANLRKLSAAFLLRADGSIIEKIENNDGQKIPMPAAEGLALIGDTQPQIGPLPEINAVGGILKLRGYIDTWLYVVNQLDPTVVQRLNDTSAIVQDFANLESR
jgi:two-component system nitrogen regulation sensor histidine kinase NtrY